MLNRDPPRRRSLESSRRWRRERRDTAQPPQTPVRHDQHTSVSIPYYNAPHGQAGPSRAPPPPDSRHRADSASSNSSNTSSTSSSLLNISARSKTGFSQFFSPRAHKKRYRAKKKRNFLGFGNSSSSSVGSDLAYGRGYIKHRRSSREFSPPLGRKPRRDEEELGRPVPQREKTDEEIIALGKKFAAIAKHQNVQDLKSSGRTRPAAILGAVAAINQMQRQSSGKLDQRERGIGNSKLRRESSPDDSEWESASDDASTSSGSSDSDLVYGSAVRLPGPSRLPEPAPFPDARQPLDVGFERPLNRKPSLVDPRLFGPVNSLHGYVEAPCGFDTVQNTPTNELPPIAGTSSFEQRPMQYVYPVPTSDPARFDAGRGPVVSSVHPDMPSQHRPAPVPLQQPKPIVPVPTRVFEAADEDTEPYVHRTASGKILAGAVATAIAGVTMRKAMSSAHKTRMERDRLRDEDSRRDDRHEDDRRRDSHRDEDVRRDDRQEEDRARADRRESTKLPKEERRKLRDEDRQADRERRRREREQRDSYDARDHDREKRQGDKYDERNRDDKPRADDYKESQDRYQEKPRESAYIDRKGKTAEAYYATPEDARREGDNYDMKGKRVESFHDNPKEVRREDDYYGRKGNRMEPLNEASRDVGASESDTYRRIADPNFPSKSSPIDPFQFQVANDAFQTPSYPTPKRPLTPSVVFVEREPDFSKPFNMDLLPAERLSRKDTHERDVRAAQEAHEIKYRGSAPITAAAAAAAVAASTAQGRMRRNTGGDREADPVQEAVNRQWREQERTRKAKEEERWSRSNSPDPSVVDQWRWAKSPDSSEPTYVTPIEIVEPAESSVKEPKKSIYDAPNADVRIDNVLEHPVELRKYQLPRNRGYLTQGTDKSLPFRSRDPSAERERPLLNLVRPTPTPSPMPEKQVERAAEPKSERPVVTPIDTSYRDADNEEEPHGTTTPVTPRTVTWGENSTKHYVVESPVREDDPWSGPKIVEPAQSKPRASKKSGWGAIAAAMGVGAAVASATSSSEASSSSGSRKTVASSVTSVSDVSSSSGSRKGSTSDRASSPAEDFYGSPPTVGPKPSGSASRSMPGSFDEDPMFTANIAAGLEGSGFDPNIILDDAKFHKRSSPPRADDQSPEVWDRGFVPGELRDNAISENDIPASSSDIYSKLSKKEKRNAEKAVNNGDDDRSVVSSTTASSAMSESVASLDSSRSSKRDQKRRDKAAAKAADAEAALAAVPMIIPARDPSPPARDDRDSSVSSKKKPGRSKRTEKAIVVQGDVSPHPPRELSRSKDHSRDSRSREAAQEERPWEAVSTVPAPREHRSRSPSRRQEDRYQSARDQITVLEDDASSEWAGPTRSELSMVSRVESDTWSTWTDELADVSVLSSTDPKTGATHIDVVSTTPPAERSPRDFASTSDVRAATGSVSGSAAAPGLPWLFNRGESTEKSLPKSPSEQRDDVSSSRQRSTKDRRPSLRFESPKRSEVVTTRDRSESPHSGRRSLGDVTTGVAAASSILALLAARDGRDRSDSKSDRQATDDKPESITRENQFNNSRSKSDDLSFVPLTEEPTTIDEDERYHPRESERGRDRKAADDSKRDFAAPSTVASFYTVSDSFPSTAALGNLTRETTIATEPDQDWDAVKKKSKKKKSSRYDSGAYDAPSREESSADVVYGPGIAADSFLSDATRSERGRERLDDDDTASVSSKKSRKKSSRHNFDKYEDSPSRSGSHRKSSRHESDKHEDSPSRSELRRKSSRHESDKREDSPSRGDFRSDAASVMPSGSRKSKRHSEIIEDTPSGRSRSSAGSEASVSSRRSKRDVDPDSPARSMPSSEMDARDSERRSKKEKRRSYPGTPVGEDGRKAGDEAMDRGPDSFKAVDDDVSSVVSFERTRSNGSKSSRRRDDNYDDAKSVTSANDGERKEPKSSNSDKDLTEKRSSGSFGLFDRFKSSMGLADEKERTRKAAEDDKKDDKKDDKNSFLDNAGTLGAGAGLTGSAFELASRFRHNASNNISTEEQNAPQTSTTPERAPSPGPLVQVELVDPEIVEREIRPAIDPQYGDLLPLPPSTRGPPVAELGELPPLPDSRPETPEHERQQRRDVFKHARKRSANDTHLKLLKSPSQSAVPLQFRLGSRQAPTSPRLPRASPMTSPVAAFADLASSVPPKNRSRPTSWEAPKEFKPLYLLEKASHDSKHEGGPALSELSDLPPSEPLSLASPKLSDAAGHDKASELTHIPSLSLDTALQKELEVSLDSEETTPKADFPSRTLDDALREQVALDGALREQLDTPSDSDVFESAAASPELPSPTARDDSDWSPPHPYPVDSMTKDHDSFLFHSSPAPTQKDSAATTPREQSPTMRPAERVYATGAGDDDSEQKKEKSNGHSGAALAAIAAATRTEDEQGDESTADEFFDAGNSPSRDDFSDARDDALSPPAAQHSTVENMPRGLPPLDTAALPDTDEPRSPEPQDMAITPTAQLVPVVIPSEVDYNPTSKSPAFINVVMETTKPALSVDGQEAPSLPEMQEAEDVADEIAERERSAPQAESVALPELTAEEEQDLFVQAEMISLPALTAEEVEDLLVQPEMISLPDTTLEEEESLVAKEVLDATDLARGASAAGDPVIASEIQAETVVLPETSLEEEEFLMGEEIQITPMASPDTLADTIILPEISPEEEEFFMGEEISAIPQTTEDILAEPVYLPDTWTEEDEASELREVALAGFPRLSSAPINSGITTRTTSKSLAPSVELSTAPITAALLIPSGDEQQPAPEATSSTIPLVKLSKKELKRRKKAEEAETAARAMEEHNTEPSDNQIVPSDAPASEEQAREAYAEIADPLESVENVPGSDTINEPETSADHEAVAGVDDVVIPQPIQTEQSVAESNKVTESVLDVPSTETLEESMPEPQQLASTEVSERYSPRSDLVLNEPLQPVAHEPETVPVKLSKKEMKRRKKLEEKAAAAEHSENAISTETPATSDLRSIDPSSSTEIPAGAAQEYVNESLRAAAAEDLGNESSQEPTAELAPESRQTPSDLPEIVMHSPPVADLPALETSKVQPQDESHMPMPISEKAELEPVPEDATAIWEKAEKSALPEQESQPDQVSTSAPGNVDKEAVPPVKDTLVEQADTLDIATSHVPEPSPLREDDLGAWGLDAGRGDSLIPEEAPASVIIDDTTTGSREAPVEDSSETLVEAIADTVRDEKEVPASPDVHTRSLTEEAVPHPELATTVQDQLQQSHETEVPGSSQAQDLQQPDLRESISEAAETQPEAQPVDALSAEAIADDEEFLSLTAKKEKKGKLKSKERKRLDELTEKIARRAAEVDEVVQAVEPGAQNQLDTTPPAKLVEVPSTPAPEDVPIPASPISEAPPTAPQADSTREAPDDDAVIAALIAKKEKKGNDRKRVEELIENFERRAAQVEEAAQPREVDKQEHHKRTQPTELKDFLDVPTAENVPLPASPVTEEFFAISPAESTPKAFDELKDEALESIAMEQPPADSLDDLEPTELSLAVEKDVEGIEQTIVPDFPVSSDKKGEEKENREVTVATELEAFAPIVDADGGQHTVAPPAELDLTRNAKELTVEDNVHAEPQLSVGNELENSTEALVVVENAVQTVESNELDGHKIEEAAVAKPEEVQSVAEEAANFDVSAQTDAFNEEPEASIGEAARSIGVSDDAFLKEAVDAPESNAESAANKAVHVPAASTIIADAPVEETTAADADVEDSGESKKDQKKKKLSTSEALASKDLPTGIPTELTTSEPETVSGPVNPQLDDVGPATAVDTPETTGDAPTLVERNTSSLHAIFAEPISVEFSQDAPAPELESMSQRDAEQSEGLPPITHDTTVEPDILEPVEASPSKKDKNKENRDSQSMSLEDVLPLAGDPPLADQQSLTIGDERAPGSDVCPVPVENFAEQETTTHATNPTLKDSTQLASTQDLVAEQVQMPTDVEPEHVPTQRPTPNLVDSVLDTTEEPLPRYQDIPAIVVPAFTEETELSDSLDKESKKVKSTKRRDSLLSFTEAASEAADETHPSPTAAATPEQQTELAESPLADTPTESTAEALEMETTERPLGPLELVENAVQHIEISGSEQTLPVDQAFKLIDSQKGTAIADNEPALDPVLTAEIEAEESERAALEAKKEKHGKLKGANKKRYAELTKKAQDRAEAQASALSVEPVPEEEIGSSQPLVADSQPESTAAEQTAEAFVPLPEDIPAVPVHSIAEPAQESPLEPSLEEADGEPLPTRAEQSEDPGSHVQETTAEQEESSPAKEPTLQKQSQDTVLENTVHDSIATSTPVPETATQDSSRERELQPPISVTEGVNDVVIDQENSLANAQPLGKQAEEPSAVPEDTAASTKPTEHDAANLAEQAELAALVAKRDKLKRKDRERFDVLTKKEKRRGEDSAVPVDLERPLLDEQKPLIEEPQDAPGLVDMIPNVPTQILEPAPDVDSSPRSLVPATFESEAKDLFEGPLADSEPTLAPTETTTLLPKESEQVTTPTPAHLESNEPLFDLESQAAPMEEALADPVPKRQENDELLGQDKKRTEELAQNTDRRASEAALRDVLGSRPLPVTADVVTDTSVSRGTPVIENDVEGSRAEPVEHPVLSTDVSPEDKHQADEVEVSLASVAEAERKAIDVQTVPEEENSKVQDSQNESPQPEISPMTEDELAELERLTAKESKGKLKSKGRKRLSELMQMSQTRRPVQSSLAEQSPTKAGASDSTTAPSKLLEDNIIPQIAIAEEVQGPASKTLDEAPSGVNAQGDNDIGAQPGQQQTPENAVAESLASPNALLHEMPLQQIETATEEQDSTSETRNLAPVTDVTLDETATLVAESQERQTPNPSVTETTRLPDILLEEPSHPQTGAAESEPEPVSKAHEPELSVTTPREQVPESGSLASVPTSDTPLSPKRTVEVSDQRQSISEVPRSTSEAPIVTAEDAEVEALQAKLASKGKLKSKDRKRLAELEQMRDLPQSNDHSVISKEAPLPVANRSTSNTEEAQGEQTSLPSDNTANGQQREVVVADSSGEGGDLVDASLPEVEQLTSTTVESRDEHLPDQTEPSKAFDESDVILDEAPTSSMNPAVAAEESELEALKNKLASKGKLKSKDRRRLEELMINAEHRAGDVSQPGVTDVANAPDLLASSGARELQHEILEGQDEPEAPIAIEETVEPVQEAAGQIPLGNSSVSDKLELATEPHSAAETLLTAPLSDKEPPTPTVDPEAAAEADELAGLTDKKSRKGKLNNEDEGRSEPTASAKERTSSTAVAYDSDIVGDDRLQESSHGVLEAETATPLVSEAVQEPATEVKKTEPLMLERQPLADEISDIPAHKAVPTTNQDTKRRTPWLATAVGALTAAFTSPTPKDDPVPVKDAISSTPENDVASSTTKVGPAAFAEPQVVEIQDSEAHAEQEELATLQSKKDIKGKLKGKDKRRYEELATRASERNEAKVGTVNPSPSVNEPGSKKTSPAVSTEYEVPPEIAIQDRSIVAQPHQPESLPVADLPTESELQKLEPALIPETDEQAVSEASHDDPQQDPSQAESEPKLHIVETMDRAEPVEETPTAELPVSPYAVPPNASESKQNEKRTRSDNQIASEETRQASKSLVADDIEKSGTQPQVALTTTEQPTADDQPLSPTVVAASRRHGTQNLSSGHVTRSVESAHNDPPVVMQPEVQVQDFNKEHFGDEDPVADNKQASEQASAQSPSWNWTNLGSDDKTKPSAQKDDLVSEKPPSTSREAQTPQAHVVSEVTKFARTGQPIVEQETSAQSEDAAEETVPETVPSQKESDETRSKTMNNSADIDELEALPPPTSMTDVTVDEHSTEADKSTVQPRPVSSESHNTVSAERRKLNIPRDKVPNLRISIDSLKESHLVPTPSIPQGTDIVESPTAIKPDQKHQEAPEPAPEVDTPAPKSASTWRSMSSFLTSMVRPTQPVPKSIVPGLPRIAIDARARPPLAESPKDEASVEPGAPPSILSPAQELDSPVFPDPDENGLEPPSSRPLEESKPKSPVADLPTVPSVVRLEPLPQRDATPPLARPVSRGTARVDLDPAVPTSHIEHERPEEETSQLSKKKRIRTVLFGDGDNVLSGHLLEGPPGSMAVSLAGEDQNGGLLPLSRHEDSEPQAEAQDNAFEPLVAEADAMLLDEPSPSETTQPEIRRKHLPAITPARELAAAYFDGRVTQDNSAVSEHSPELEKPVASEPSHPAKDLAVSYLESMSTHKEKSPKRSDLKSRETGDRTTEGTATTPREVAADFLDSRFHPEKREHSKHEEATGGSDLVAAIAIVGTVGAGAGVAATISSPADESSKSKEKRREDVFFDGAEENVVMDARDRRRAKAMKNRRSIETRDLEQQGKIGDDTVEAEGTHMSVGKEVASLLRGDVLQREDQAKLEEDEEAESPIRGRGFTPSVRRARRAARVEREVARAERNSGDWDKLDTSEDVEEKSSIDIGLKRSVATPTTPNSRAPQPLARTRSIKELGRVSTPALASVEEEGAHQESIRARKPHTQLHEPNRDSGFGTNSPHPSRRSVDFNNEAQRDSGVHMREETETQAPGWKRNGTSEYNESGAQVAWSSNPEEKRTEVRAPQQDDARSPKKSLVDEGTPILSTPTRERNRTRDKKTDQGSSAAPEQREMEVYSSDPARQRPLRTSPSKVGKYGELGRTSSPSPAMSPRSPRILEPHEQRSISESYGGRRASPRLENTPPAMRRTASNSSLSRLRTPEPITFRPDSPSNQSVRSLRSATGGAGTPPLRRADRRASGDLRSLGQRAGATSHSTTSHSPPGSVVDLDNNNSSVNKGVPHPSAETDKATAPAQTATTTIAGATALAITAAAAAAATKSSTTPVANEGRARSSRDTDRDMADVYDGVGEGRLGSPRSPTRPHSMRRRQSIQVLELESRVEALLAENQQLQHQTQHAEQVNARSAATKADRDAQIELLRASLTSLQAEVTRLSQVNDGLQSANSLLAMHHTEKYGHLESQHATVARELEKHRGAKDNLATELEQKDAEIARLRNQLEATKEEVRELQRQILASKPPDAEFLRLRDEDHFDQRCQQLCSHVQQWVLRFSKFSDMRACRLTGEINDEKIIDKLDNSILDGTDVDDYLIDRVRRRDVFLSMTMNMIWEFVFTRYLFGMDREQRQKLKSVEKLLQEVGPPQAVRQWRAVTLTLLSKRPSFGDQRNQDTEAVVQAILQTLSMILPPPSHLENQIQSQLRRVLRDAVDLSIEMRTQRAEYMMLPPLQPEYDANGDLAETVKFNAALMSERSGSSGPSNEELEEQGAVVRFVLFPLVVKKGDDFGVGDDEIVVCPAQVIVAKARGSSALRGAATTSLIGSDLGGSTLGVGSNLGGGSPLKGGTPSALGRSTLSVNMTDAPADI